MAYGSIGVDLFTGNNSAGGGNTIIMITSNATCSGIVKYLTFNSRVAGTLKVKIFRDDGTSYLFIKEVSLQTVVGNNINVPVWLPCMKGDMIGIYTAGTNVAPDYVIADSRAYRAGDITSDTPKSGWTHDILRYAIGGKVFKRVAPL